MGTAWDFQEPFCYNPWEPGTGLCTPQSPIENPEAAQRNAKCQWSGCTSTFREREKDGGTRLDLLVLGYAEARSETVLTLLLKVSISTNCKRSSLADPDLWATVRPAKQNVWKCCEKRVKTNKMDLKSGCLQESEAHMRWIGYWLKTLNLPYNLKFVDAIRALLMAYSAAETLHSTQRNTTPLLLVCLKLLSLRCISENKAL